MVRSTGAPRPWRLESGRLESGGEHGLVAARRLQSLERRACLPQSLSLPPPLVWKHGLGVHGLGLHGLGLHVQRPMTLPVQQRPVVLPYDYPQTLIPMLHASFWREKILHWGGQQRAAHGAALLVDAKDPRNQAWTDYWHLLQQTLVV